MTQANNTVPPPFPVESARPAQMIVAMGGIGVIAAVLLVTTYVMTLPAIERNQAEALQRAIFTVLPGASQTTEFTVVDGGLRVLEPDQDAPLRYYAGYDGEGRLAGVAVDAQGQGFMDILRILYGYSPGCECVVGFTVLESKETPGLGDKIETDSTFTANFDALDVTLTPDQSEILNPIVLVKPGQKTEPWQIDSITGATISSRAVATILNESTVATVPLLMRNLEVLEHGVPADQPSETN